MLPSGKSTWVLNSFLDIMHRIFRKTLFPRIGDKDKVHSYLVDMLLLCAEARSSQTQPLDVSHIMWCELRFAVFTRKVPIHGPYLFLLLSTTWEKMYPGDEFLAPDWIRHESISLRVKPNWANTTTRGEHLLLGGLLVRGRLLRTVLRTVLLRTVLPGPPLLPLSHHGPRS